MSKVKVFCDITKFSFYFVISFSFPDMLGCLSSIQKQCRGVGANGRRKPFEIEIGYKILPIPTIKVERKLCRLYERNEGRAKTKKTHENCQKDEERSVVPANGERVHTVDTKYWNIFA